MKRKTWVPAGVAVLVALIAAVVVMSGAKEATPAENEPPAYSAGWRGGSSRRWCPWMGR